jgi:hypothetical protein
MIGHLITVIRCMEIMLVRAPQTIHRIPCDLEYNLGNAYDQELNKIKQLSMN